MKKKIEANGGSTTGVNMETGLRSGWQDEDYMKCVAGRVVVFAVGNPGEKVMTVADALKKDAQRPGMVGTVETMGVP